MKTENWWKGTVVLKKCYVVNNKNHGLIISNRQVPLIPKPRLLDDNKDKDLGEVSCAPSMSKELETSRNLVSISGSIPVDSKIKSCIIGKVFLLDGVEITRN